MSIPCQGAASSEWWVVGSPEGEYGDQQACLTAGGRHSIRESTGER